MLNPPYGRDISAWMRKAAAEARQGNAAIVVVLVPASVDAAWFRQAAGGASLVRFWPGPDLLRQRPRALPLGGAGVRAAARPARHHPGMVRRARVRPGVLASPPRRPHLLGFLPQGAVARHARTA